MNPPTPYPASARSRSKNQSENRDTAFREITGRANTISKSVHDSFNGNKKMEEEQTEKCVSKTPLSRRYSVASKFAGLKADNNIVSNAGAPLQSKPKLSKRDSFQGVISEPRIYGTSNQVSLASSKSTSISSSKSSIKGTTVPSMQSNIPGALYRRQSLASGQASKPYKPTAELFKRSAPGCGKADLTPAHTSQARGMLLKSACYWMEQVKLAEMMEKYGVSIGFFRLAVECGAEPIELLKEELTAFIGRYSLWSDTIQQLLLCYGVKHEDQEALFSRLAASGINQSSPWIPGETDKGSDSADKERVDQALKETKRTDKDLNSAVGEDPAGGITDKVVPIPDGDPVLGVREQLIHTGHIESMDAESITREVVSCIMSSMQHIDSCNVGKSFQPKNDVMIISTKQNNHPSSATEAAANCAVSTQESLSDPNSVFLEDATSSESLPSLNVWNAMPKDATCTPAGQEEVTLILDNDINDSTSTSRVSEETCVSMELVDTLSDDLQSSNATLLSTEVSAFHASQTTNEGHGNLLEDSSAMSSGERHVVLPQSSTHNKSQSKPSGKVQNFEKCGSEPCKDHKSKNASSKAKSELPVLLTPNEPETTSIRRTSHVFSGRHQNSKEKSAPVSETTKTESLASNTDKSVALATSASRRFSLSTPRSLTSAHTPNHNAISRTRSKGRLLQPMEQGRESHQMQLTNPVAEPGGVLVTPRHDSRLVDEDGSKQASINPVDGTEMQTIDATDLTATPGSAGVRRSARLIKPAGVSTPSSVSTPHLQRRLGTPKNAEK